MKETRKKGKEKNDSNQLLTYSSEDAFGISWKHRDHCTTQQWKIRNIKQDPREEKSRNH
jgi:hypothetical protein